MASRKVSGQGSKGEAFWLRVIREQRRAGLSVGALCRKRGVSESAYYYWKRRLRQLGKIAEESSGPSRRSVIRASEAPLSGKRSHATSLPTFAAVRLPPRGAVDRDIELALSRGRRLRIPRGFDTETLRRLLGVLEGHPC